MPKRAEVQALSTNDAHVVKFLRKLVSHFGMRKSLIRDRGTHFCNAQLAMVLKKIWCFYTVVTPYRTQISR